MSPPPAPRGAPRKQAAKKAAPPSVRGGGPAQERELRAQGKKTMRKLIDAGMTVFEKRGYHAARVDDIVKLARTSHGTFYLYFSSKEDLFRALLADVAEGFNELAGELGEVGPGDDGLRELRAWLARFTDFYVRYGPAIRAWTEAEIDDSDIGRLGDEVLTGFARTFQQQLAATGSAKGVNAQLAALALVAMVERFNYYVYSRRIHVERDDMIDTLASIIHVGLFGGDRKVPRKAAARRT